jgi:hypothetical protein
MWRRQTAHASNLDVLGPARRLANQEFWKVDLRDPNRNLTALEWVEKVSVDGLETIIDEKTLRKLLFRFHSDGRILMVIRMVANMEIFAGCTIKELILVVESLGVIVYKYGEAVASEGDRGDCLVIVSDGMLLARRSSSPTEQYVGRALEAIRNGTELESIIGDGAFDLMHAPRHDAPVYRLSQAEKNELSQMLLCEGQYCGEQSLLEAHHHTNLASIEAFGSKLDGPDAECLVLHMDVFQRLPLHLVDRVRLNILRRDFRKDTAGKGKGGTSNANERSVRATNVPKTATNAALPSQAKVKLLLPAEEQAAKIALSMSRWMTSKENAALYPNMAVPRASREGNRTVHAVADASCAHGLREAKADGMMMQVHSTILTILSMYILTMAYDAGTQHYTHNTINIYTYYGL